MSTRTKQRRTKGQARTKKQPRTLCDNCSHERVSLVINGRARARTASAIGFHAGKHLLWVPYSISTIEQHTWGYQVYVPTWFHDKNAHLIKHL